MNHLPGGKEHKETSFPFLVDLPEKEKGKGSKGDEKRYRTNWLEGKRKNHISITVRPGRQSSERDDITRSCYCAVERKKKQRVVCLGEKDKGISLSPTKKIGGPLYVLFTLGQKAHHTIVISERSHYYPWEEGRVPGNRAKEKKGASWFLAKNLRNVCSLQRTKAYSVGG